MSSRIGSTESGLTVDMSQAFGPQASQKVTGSLPRFQTTLTSSTQKKESFLREDFAKAATKAWGWIRALFWMLGTHLSRDEMLAESVKRGDLGLVWGLIFLGANPEAKDAKQGRTALEIAFAQQNIPMMCLLLTLGAKPEVSGQPLLSTAYGRNKTEVVLFLLRSGFSAVVEEGQPILPCAIRDKKYDLAAALVDSGLVDVNAPMILMGNKSDHNPLRYAYNNYREEVKGRRPSQSAAEAYEAQAASVLLSTYQAQANKSPLVSLIKSLIQKGAYLTYEGNKIQGTLFHQAVSERKPEVAAALIQDEIVQVDPKNKADQEHLVKATRMAFENHNPGLALFFAQQGAGFVDEAEPVSLLALAVKKGWGDVAEALLNNLGVMLDTSRYFQRLVKQNRTKQPPEERSTLENRATATWLDIPEGETEMTAVQHAVARGKFDMATDLISKGASLEALDKDGRTVFHQVAIRGDAEGAHFLLQLSQGKALLEVGDSEGNTVLHLAASRGDIPMVQYLVQKGASLEAQNDRDLTPQQVAFEKDSNEDCTQVSRYLTQVICQRIAPEVAAAPASEVPAPAPTKPEVKSLKDKALRFVNKMRR